MPKKSEEKEVEVITTEEVEVQKGASLCGHINKQFHNIKGKIEDLACTLPAGHDGDHSAKHLALRQVEDNFETAELVANGAKTYTIAGKVFMAIDVDGFWSDAAGVLATSVKPDLEQLKQLRLKRRAEQEAEV